MTAVVLWVYADAQVNRTSLDAIQDQGTETAPPADTRTAVEFLVVGSDDRSSLTEEQQVELSTGRDAGPVRTDVLLLVQVRPDGGTSMLSIPRDLLIDHNDAEVKINSVLAQAGRDGLVERIEDLVGVELEHYVEVSIPAFLEAVEAVGGVEVCLDEPLVDEKAGADLPAGCQELDAERSLAFVRSREGARGDFRRIERQQQFLQALADELTSARTAVDVPRLFRLANRVGSSLTTSKGLGLNELRRLAQRLEGLAAGELEAATLPAYAVEDGLRLYEPGAATFFAALDAVEPLPHTGSREARSAAEVVLHADGGGLRSEQVESVLFFYGFGVSVESGTPIEPLGVEVFDGPPSNEVATWVANVLGVEVGAPPADVTVDSDAMVVVGS